jgi:hypothetical protein
MQRLTSFAGFKDNFSLVPSRYGALFLEPQHAITTLSDTVCTACASVRVKGAVRSFTHPNSWWAGTIFDLGDIDFDRVEAMHTAHHRVHKESSTAMLTDPNTWLTLKQQQGMSGEGSPRSVRSEELQNVLWRIATGKAGGDWAPIHRVVKMVKNIYDPDKKGIRSKAKCEALALEWVVKSEAQEDGKKKVAKEIFVEWWANQSEEAQTLSAKVVKLSHVWVKDWATEVEAAAGGRTSNKELEYSVAKAVCERIWMTETYIKAQENGEQQTNGQSVSDMEKIMAAGHHDDSDSVKKKHKGLLGKVGFSDSARVDQGWDWDEFEKRFQDWWDGKMAERKSKNVMVSHGVGSGLTFRMFVTEWVAHEDVVLQTTLEHVKWHASIVTAKHMWDSADKNCSGWITRNDGRLLVGNIPLRDGKLRTTLPSAEPGSVNSTVNELIEKSESTRQISRRAWHQWWRDLPWQVKNFTHKMTRLRMVWAKLDHTGNGKMEPWEAKALLKSMNKYQTQDEQTQDAKFIKWWSLHDRDESGTITIEEFASWWVHQSDSMLAAAEQIDWAKAEKDMKRLVVTSDMNQGFEAGSSEHEREQRFLEKNRLMDREIALATRDDDQQQQAMKFLRNSKWTKQYGHVKSDRQPFGQSTGASRPPMIRTRLMKYKVLQQSQESASKNEPQDETKKLREQSVTMAGGGLETIGELLGDYRRARRRFVCLDRVQQWVSKYIFAAHRGLFVTALADLERRFGHGIAELMQIMRFMLLLNALLGSMWMAMVIIPREAQFSGFTNVTTAVFAGLFLSDEDTASSIYYGGYENVEVDFYGLRVNMDVLYFMAIALNVVLSLVVILRTLGVKVSALAQGGDLNLNLEEETVKSKKHKGLNHNVVDFAQVLGAYDSSVTSEAAHMEMRQQIRHTLEKWLMKHEEEEAQKEIYDNKWRYVKHQATLLSGKVATLVVLSLHVYGIAKVLELQPVLSEYSALIAPLTISMLNVGVPQILKLIVLHEDHVKAESELRTTMIRVYAVKMIQMLVVLFTMYNDTVLDETCPEDRYGALFLKMVLTDAMVFMSMQYGYLYAVNHGLPKIWKFIGPWSVTTNYEPTDKNQMADEFAGKEARKTAATLQWRMYKPPRRTVADALRGVPKSKKHASWWRLTNVNGGDRMQPVMKWVTSKDIQHLTGLTVNVLRVYAQMLEHAGYKKEGDVIAANLSPDALTKAIMDQRGGHRHAPHADVHVVPQEVLQAERMQHLQSAKAAAATAKSAVASVAQINPMQEQTEDRAVATSFLEPLLLSTDSTTGAPASSKLLRTMQKFIIPGDKLEAEGDLQGALEAYIASIQKYRKSGKYSSEKFNQGVVIFARKSHGATYFRETITTDDELVIDTDLNRGSTIEGPRTLSVEPGTLADNGSVSVKTFQLQLELKLLVLKADLALLGAMGMVGEEGEKPGKLPFALHSYKIAGNLSRELTAALGDDRINTLVRKRGHTAMHVFNQHTRKMKGKDAETQILNVATQLVNSEGEWIEVTDDVTMQRMYKIEPFEFENFRSAIMMIDFLYRQTFVWVGSTWCPWLPMVACIMQVLMFLSLKHAMLNGAYRRPVEPWSAEKTFKVFMAFALATLLVCAIPGLVWMNVMPGCGPHLRPMLTAAYDSMVVEDQLLEDHPDLHDTIDGDAPGLVTDEQMCGYVKYREQEGTWVVPDEDSHSFCPGGATNEPCCLIQNINYLAPVFTTFGVSLDRLTVEEGFRLGGYAASIGAFVTSPPALMIVVCIMWARYRYARAEAKIARSEVTKTRQQYVTEKQFLTDELRKALVNSKDGGVDLLPNHQAMLERTMRALESTQEGGIEDICKSMNEDIDEDTHTNSDHTISAIELQQFVKLAGDFDDDGDGQLDNDDIARWSEMVSDNTIWIGGISFMYATEKNIRNHLTTDGDGATIIACTVKRISEEEEAALIEQHPDSPTWHHKSWALVTFLHKRTQLAKLESFPNFPEGADPTDATGRQNAIVLGMDAVDEAGRQVTVARKKMQSTSGFAENTWASLAWEHAQWLDIPDLHGIIGRKAVRVEPDQDMDSEYVAEHTAELQRCLDAALTAKTTVADLGALESRGAEVVQQNQVSASLFPDKGSDKAAASHKALKKALEEVYTALDKEAQASLAAACQPQNYHADYDIVVEGEPGENMYIIANKGAKVDVTVALKCQSKGRQTLVTLEQHQFFGESSILNNDICNATCTAVTDTTCVLVPKWAFNEYLAPHWAA